MAALSGSNVLPNTPVADQAWIHGLQPDSIAEKRHSDRRTLHGTAQMIPLGGEDAPHAADALLGECLNISESGFYGTLPVGYGMAVGQRYVFRLRAPESDPQGSHTVLRQGVIVRTELLISPDGSDQVGIGVRFNGYPGGNNGRPAQA